MLVSAFVVILSQFSLAGWPEYVMQWSGGIERPRQVLTVSMVAGVALAGLVVAASLLLPMVGPETAILLQVLALCIPFASLGATYAGILNWENRLVAAALTVSLCEGVGFIVAAIALLNGQGALSLAYGRLAGAIVWAGANALLVGAWPKVKVPLALVSEMSRFAGRIMAVRLLVNARLYAATLLIGGFLGAAEAGFFRAGQRLVSALSEILGEPTRALAWSLFRSSRSAQSGGVDFRDTANGLYPAVIVCAIPAFAVVAVLADDIVRVFLGDGWEPAAAVVRILALAYALFATGYATEAVLSLAGQVRLMPWLTAIYAAIGIGFTLLAAPHGMVATAWAQVLAAVLTFAINAAVEQRTANVRWWEIIVRLRVLPAALAAMLALAWALAAWGGLTALPALLGLTVSALLMLATFGLTALALDSRLRRLARARWKRRHRG